jgi:hypothetical protein
VTHTKKKEKEKKKEKGRKKLKIGATASEAFLCLLRPQRPAPPVVQLWGHHCKESQKGSRVTSGIIYKAKRG